MPAEQYCRVSVAKEPAMYAMEISALGKAWVVTMVAICLLSAALVTFRICSSGVFLRALEDTLVSEPI
jgi:hypothetical protein